MQLDHINLIWSYIGLFVNFLGTFFGHVTTDQVNRRIRIESGRKIRGHVDSFDLNRLVLKVVSNHKFLTANDGAPGTIRSWAALKLGERIMDLG
jgi:hypothetical protein